MKIKIFTTGGTFDKEYNEITEQLEVKETHILDMLKQGRSLVDIDIEPLMRIDSLLMTDDNREQIVEKCKSANEKNILIIHGTGTAEKTAQLLVSEIKDKTIVLTGAMIPFRVEGTDSLFNLGAALAYDQSLPNGVYVAMNGKAFYAASVTKNVEKGIFEEPK